MNNVDRFIVQGQLSDGNPGYWNPANGGEWWADRDKAKVYKFRAYAERVATQYGGEVIQLTSRLKNESVYAYDVLSVLKRLNWRATSEPGWNNAEYLHFHKGAQHAYGEAAKMLRELLEQEGVDVDLELTFVSDF